jgi:hypothetical protein
LEQNLTERYDVFKYVDAVTVWASTADFPKIAVTSYRISDGGIKEA